MVKMYSVVIGYIDILCLVRDFRSIWLGDGRVLCATLVQSSLLPLA